MARPVGSWDRIVSDTKMTKDALLAVSGETWVLRKYMEVAGKHHYWFQKIRHAEDL